MAAAQTRAQIISAMPGDMGFYAGIYAPMYKGQESDITLGFTYGHFNANGLGYKAGLQFTPSVAEIDNVLGVPVAIAYRTRSADSKGRLARGAIAAGETFGYDVIMGYPDPLRGALASFIANLFSQFEFYAGMTPGYISGDSAPVSTSYTRYGTTRTEDNSWTELNGHFSLTLDAGAYAHYRIWRFDLKLGPAFHYNLTRNYVFHTETNTFTDGSDIVEWSSSEQALRWFFSLNAGLTFRF